MKKQRTASHFVACVSAVVFSVAGESRIYALAICTLELVGRTVAVFRKRGTHAQVLVRVIEISTVVESVTQLK
jgi:hypothetical protein